MKTTTIHLTNENVTLTTYLLDASSEMKNANVRPAVLILPGGGYTICSDREAEPVAMAFLAEGYHAFVLRYSLNENAAFPKPLNDAEEALELIRNNSEEWAIHPNKIAVCGFSAGGHLTAALGTMGRIRPNALILGYPAILSSISDILPAPVPGLDEYVDDTTPPTFIFHTYADYVVPAAHPLAFAAALDRAKIPFEFHLFQNGIHGLSLSKPLTSSGMKAFVDPDAEKWFSLCISWLKNVLGDFTADIELHLLNEKINEYHLDLQVGVLWNNAKCQELLDSMLPQLKENPLFKDVLFFYPLRKVIDFVGDHISADSLKELEQKLKAVPVE